MPAYPLTVGGVTYDVDFPHEAYDCQLAMMEKVVEALAHNRNALLESPTGARPPPSRLRPTSLASVGTLRSTAPTRRPSRETTPRGPQPVDADRRPLFDLLLKPRRYG